MATTYLTRTPSGSGSQRKFTFSFWVKRGGLSSQQHIFTQYSANSGDRQFRIEFQANDTMRIYNTDGAADWILFVTNRVFRDSSAWMHIVVAIDTTQSTESNRVKIYINGSQETSFSTSIYPSLNRDLDINTTTAQVIGALSSSSVSSYFDGSLTHFHFIDNTQYQASDFGESDSVSSIWKPKTSPSVTYGSNGYFLKFENSGAMGTDSSGNSNTFTVSGTLTQNVDTPSNNYATFNPLVGYSNGNYVGTSRANTRAGINFGTTSTTLIPNKGKWFIEYHFQNASSNTDAGVGGWSINTSQVYGYGSAGFKGIVWKYAGNVYVDGTNNVVASDTYTNGDIISIAINYDDDLITFYKNGSTATNLTNYSYSFSNYSDFSTGILDGASSSSYDENFDLNAGQNPTFGGRKTAGTYADANGHGLFSMAVPSGYYAINTKNIKEFG